jgi:XisH protein
MYQNVIEVQGLDFCLYMAISSTVYEERFQSPLAQLMLERGGINLLVFDIQQEIVEQWIELTNTDR